VTSGIPSERGVVPTSEAFAPLPTVGLPFARSGGQAAAQAPVHSLFVPESFRNRYSVRPCELTRMSPRLSFATPIVAALPFDVVGVVELLLPPQPATACRWP
jgi:hypothetical protein